MTWTVDAAKGLLWRLREQLDSDQDEIFACGVIFARSQAQALIEFIAGSFQDNDLPTPWAEPGARG